MKKLIESFLGSCAPDMNPMQVLSVTRQLLIAGESGSLARYSALTAAETELLLIKPSTLDSEAAVYRLRRAITEELARVEGQLMGVA